MSEADQLERALHRLSTCTQEWDRPTLVKAVLLWAGRTHGHIKAIEELLTKQLEWLDTHESHAAYETHYADWISNLRLYTRSCDLLLEAKQQTFLEPAA